MWLRSAALTAVMETGNQCRWREKMKTESHTLIPFCGEGAGSHSHYLEAGVSLGSETQIWFNKHLFLHHVSPQSYTDSSHVLTEERVLNSSSDKPPPPFFFKVQMLKSGANKFLCRKTGYIGANKFLFRKTGYMYYFHINNLHHMQVCIPPCIILKDRHQFNAEARVH